MAQLNIFDYNDYKRFLIDWLQAAPYQGRGLRKELAKALNCQMSYITHVLSGGYHFSLEQAEACGQWLQLNESETDYLILLTLYERAGTKSLKARLRKQASQLREEHANLKARLNVTESISIEDQITYYSSWHYAAIHMAILNTQLNSIQALSHFFNLPKEKVQQFLTFLIEKGFISNQKNSLKVIKPVMHLEQNSPIINQHHSQWRIKAIDSLSYSNSEDLHYSGVISLSKEHFEWIKTQLSLLLKEIVVKLEKSPDEKLCCLNFDWFNIK